MAHIKHEQFDFTVNLYEKTLLNDGRVVMRMRCEKLELEDTFETYTEKDRNIYRCIELHAGNEKSGKIMYNAIFELKKD